MRLFNGAARFFIEVPQLLNSFGNLIKRICRPNSQMLTTTAFQFEFTGIEIISTGKIIVFGKNPTNGTSDVYSISPIEDIGNDYIVASHRPPGRFNSYLGIIATEPNTEVLLSVPPRLHRNITVTFGNNNCMADKEFEIKLRAFESAELESLQDLTGLRIKANHVIVVFLAETFGRTLPNGTKLLESVQSQLSPSKHWKNSYMAVPNSISSSHDIFHILGKYKVQ